MKKTHPTNSLRRRFSIICFGVIQLTAMDSDIANCMDAWRELTRTLSPLVYHWIDTGNLSPSDCDDIFQEVFLSVMKNLRKQDWNQPRSNFKGRVRVITGRRVKNHFHREKRKTTITVGSQALRKLVRVAIQFIQTRKTLISHHSGISKLFPQSRSLKRRLKTQPGMRFGRLQFKNDVLPRLPKS